jgi:hypothetical protein
VRIPKNGLSCVQFRRWKDLQHCWLVPGSCFVEKYEKEVGPQFGRPIGGSIRSMGRMETVPSASVRNPLSYSKEPSLTCRSWRQSVLGADSGTGVAVGWAGLRTAWRAEVEDIGFGRLEEWRPMLEIAKRNLWVRVQMHPAKRR